MTYREFETLAEVRDWLNASEEDLSVIYPDSADKFTISIFNHPMSDGSSVRNAALSPG